MSIYLLNNLNNNNLNYKVKYQRVTFFNKYIEEFSTTVMSSWILIT